MVQMVDENHPEAAPCGSVSLCLLLKAGTGSVPYNPATIRPIGIPLGGEEKTSALPLSRKATKPSDR